MDGKEAIVFCDMVAQTMVTTKATQAAVML